MTFTKLLFCTVTVLPFELISAFSDAVFNTVSEEDLKKEFQMGVAIGRVINRICYKAN